jgi:hypothetical protein
MQFRNVDMAFMLWFLARDIICRGGWIGIVVAEKSFKMHAGNWQSKSVHLPRENLIHFVG